LVAAVFPAFPEAGLLLPSRQKCTVERVARLHDADDLLRVLRKHDDIRFVLFSGESIALVGGNGGEVYG